MSSWMENDIETMLAGVGGVVVSHGSETGHGTLDVFDQELLRGMDSNLIGKVQAVTVRTAAFPTVKIGDAVTVDGVASKIIHRLREGDGALTKLVVRS